MYLDSVKICDCCDNKWTECVCDGGYTGGNICGLYDNHERLPHAGFAVTVQEVKQALIADDNMFALWCLNFIRPHLLRGESVAVKIVPPDAITP